MSEFSPVFMAEYAHLLGVLTIFICRVDAITSVDTRDCRIPVQRPLLRFKGHSVEERA